MSLYIFNYETNSDNIESLERTASDTQWFNPVLHRKYKKGDVIKAKLDTLSYTLSSSKTSGTISTVKNSDWKYYIFTEDVPTEIGTYYLLDYTTLWSVIKQDDLLEKMGLSNFKTKHWGKEYVQETSGSDYEYYEPGDVLYFTYNSVFYSFIVTKEFKNNLTPWYLTQHIYQGVAHSEAILGIDFDCASDDDAAEYFGISGNDTIMCDPDVIKWNDIPPVLNTIAVLDDYESLIWKDRLNEPGTFQLDTVISEDNMQYFKTGYWCATENSNKWMIIESIETNYSSNEGCYKATIIGRSLESILDRRIAFPADDLTGNEYTYKSTGLYEGLRKLAYDYFIYPEGFIGFDTNGNKFSFPNRRIPGLYWKALQDTETTHVVLNNSIRETCDEDSLLEYYQDICQKFDIGFSIVPVKVLGNRYIKLELALYNGIDKSSTIILSEMLNNVDSMNYTEDISEEKTFAFCKKDKDVTNTYVDLTSWLTDDDEEDDTETNGVTSFINAIKGRVTDFVGQIAASDIAWKLMYAIFSEAGSSFSNLNGITPTVYENTISGLNEDYIHEVQNNFWIGKDNHLKQTYDIIQGGSALSYSTWSNTTEATCLTFYGDALLYYIYKNGWKASYGGSTNYLQFDTESFPNADDRCLNPGEVVTSITTDGKISDKAYYMVIEHLNNNNETERLCLVGNNKVSGITPTHFYIWPKMTESSGYGAAIYYDSNTTDGKQDTLQYVYVPSGDYTPTRSSGWMEEQIIDYDTNTKTEGYYTLSGDTSWKRFLYSTASGWFTKAILDAVIKRYTSSSGGIGALIYKYAQKLSGSYSSTTITKSLYGSYDRGPIGLNRKEVMVDQDNEDNEFSSADQAAFIQQTTIESETEEEDEESDASVVNKLNNSARRKINDHSKKKELEASVNEFDKIYGTDYNLGDYTRSIDLFGHDQISLINEVTITDDTKGYKILPTFDKHELIPEYYTRLQWINCSNFITNIKVNYYEDRYTNPKLNSYTITTSTDSTFGETQFTIKYNFKWTKIYFKGDIPQRYINTAVSWTDVNPGALFSMYCDKSFSETIKEDDETEAQIDKHNKDWVTSIDLTTVGTTSTWKCTMQTYHNGLLAADSLFIDSNSNRYRLSFYTDKDPNYYSSIYPYYGVTINDPTNRAGIIATYDNFYNSTGTSQIEISHNLRYQIPYYIGNQLLSDRIDFKGNYRSEVSSDFSKDPAYFPIFGESQHPYFCVGGKYNIPTSQDNSEKNLGSFIDQTMVYSAIETSTTESDSPIQYKGVVVEKIDAWEYDATLTVVLKQFPKRTTSINPTGINSKCLICTEQSLSVDKNSGIKTHELVPVQLTDIDEDSESSLAYQYGFYDLIQKEFVPLANGVNDNASYIDNGGKYVDS